MNRERQKFNSKINDKLLIIGKLTDNIYKKVDLERQNRQKRFARIKEMVKVFTNSEKINLSDTKLSVNLRKNT